jgi:DNA polymerase-3 subunit alpha
MLLTTEKRFDPNIENIDLTCKKTWNLISSGNTKGCFQLESRLGRSIAKKLKPENIEQLSALIAILRPGCLEAIRDGKSVTNHYIDKKNGEETIDYFHKSLEPILKTTYGEMIYQEQAMEIAKTIAGFDLKEADMLRKAIGKKKPEEMAKIKTKFLAGCKRLNIVSEDEGEQIFGWIEKSQRYSFNKSHSVSYAMNAYLSAYAKAHFPKIFFTAYMSYAKDKIDPHEEIKELVQNAVEMDILVDKPNLKFLNKNVELKNDIIYFGLTDIKGFGESAYKKLITILTENHIDLETAKWMDIILLLTKINISGARALIQAGALDYFGISRNQMLFELNILNQLTVKEIDRFKTCYDPTDNLQNNLGKLIDSFKLTSKRKEAILQLCHSLIHPPYSLGDSIEWIVDTENMLLGCSISCSKVDMYDISMVTYTCKDFKKGLNAKSIMLAGEIENIRVVKTKKGKDIGSEMAFVSLNDGTASVDSIIFFPEVYRAYRNQLFTGNVIIVKGVKSKTKEGLVVEKTYIPQP